MRLSREAEAPLKPIESVGTGGWAYLPRFTTDRLRGCAMKFQFVEANVTFYRDVEPETARKWRLRVPTDFEFSVKCSRELTHVHRMKPIAESYIVIDRMKEICRELRASVLVLQTPASMKIDDVKLRSLRDFFSSFDRGELEIGWEVRSQLDPKSLAALSQLVIDNGIIHVTDLSVSRPIVSSSLVYTRLFGRGAAGGPAYRFSYEQLEQVRERVLSLGASKVNYAFHSLRMYDDAERFLEILAQQNVAQLQPPQSQRA